LYVGITRKKVDWIIDLDIRSLFDKIGHEWMIQLVEHRIGGSTDRPPDPEMAKAGVMEDGKWFGTEEGGARRDDHRTLRR